MFLQDINELEIKWGRRGETWDNADTKRNIKFPEEWKSNLWAIMLS